MPLATADAAIDVDLDDLAILALGDGAEFPFLVGAGLTIRADTGVDGHAAIAANHHSAASMWD
jgi:hypothetical protein